jgi:hypothetical protein
MRRERRLSFANQHEGRDGPPGRPFWSARPAVAPYQLPQAEMRGRARSSIRIRRLLDHEGGLRSEFFRAEHGGDQIEEEEHRDKSDDEVFHGGGG